VITEKESGFCGSNMCENPPPNCAMSRGVLPERVFQYEDGRVNTEINVKAETRSKRRASTTNSRRYKMLN